MLGKLSVPGRPTHLDDRARAYSLAIGAGGRCLDIFLSSIHSLSFVPQRQTARYRLKYCLKEPRHPKQPTNQPTFRFIVHLSSRVFSGYFAKA